jgi:predicted deacylase|tara:strand:- start:182 stop:910 length:729 start_codon:yes stop_codon:yes gene_type:complete
MKEYSPYHKLIPERVEVLENLKSLLGRNCKVHFNIDYAERKLSVLSYVINPEIKKTIMITAGCHGNEPAPIYALYNFLKSNPKIRNKRIVIVPCIVPSGFCLHIDKNINGIDINRNFFSKQPQKETKLLKQLVKKYKPTFVLNLHEDPDEKMFFLYLEGKNYRQKAEKLVSLVSKDMKFYKRKKVHNDMVINGIIESDDIGTSFEDYLKKLNIPNFCVETPGIYPLQDRVKVHEKILKFIVK